MAVRTLSKGLAGIVAVLLLSLLASCTNNADTTDFLENLDIIDSCIARSQYAEAASLLRKTQRAAYTEQQHLSVVKRYFALGDDTGAEQYLKATLKKRPESVALAAVYAGNLLDRGKLADAEPYAARLKNSPYESIYAEFLLKSAVSTSDFANPVLAGLYERVYQTTGDERWLCDAAVLAVAERNTKKAALYAPLLPANSEHRYFWALIHFAARNYGQCLAFCLAEADPRYTAKAELLASDAYLCMGEIEEARAFWELNIAEYSAQGLVAPKEMYKNLARYHTKAGNLARAKDLLFTLVTEYPSYSAGLADYAAFAVRTEDAKTGSGAFTGDIQGNGLDTLFMEQNALVPTLPVSDALYRIEQALKNGYDDERLLVTYTRLRWREQGFSAQQCTGDLWRLLEETRTQEGHSPVMVHFAVSYFLRHHEEQIALSLFSDYCTSRYGTNDLADYAGMLADWECETAAYFELSQKNGAAALKLYEHYFFVREHLDDTRLALNLGAVYQALGRPSDAMEVYSAAARAETDPLLLSDVHYRIATVQNMRNEKRNALLSLSYSLELNPENHRARLLHSQLSQ